MKTKRICHVISSLLFIFSVTYAEENTITLYNSLNGNVYYPSSKAIKQGARFDIIRPIKIKSVKFNVSSDSCCGEGILRILGHEGGVSFPAFENDIIKPVHFYKSKTGIQEIEVSFNESLILENNQFFIIFDSLSNNLQLVSDKNDKQNVCENEFEKYYNQCIYNSDGKWVYGKYSYKISVIYENIDSNEDPIFEETEDKDSIFFQNNNNYSIAVADINNDKLLDIINNGKLFINKGNMGFNCIDFNKDSLDILPLINCFIDINHDGLTDILLMDSNKTNERNSVAYINNGELKFVKTYLYLPEIVSPTSISIVDINNDSFNDLYITQCGESGEYLPNVLLINSGLNSFISSNLFTVKNSKNNNTISSSFFDIDNDNDLDLIEIGKNGLIQYWQNSGISFELKPSIENEINTNNEEKIESMDVSDLNLDGKNDIIVPVTNIQNHSGLREIKGSRILVNKNNIIKSNEEMDNLFEFEESQTGVSCGDINNDGLEDVLFFTDCICRYVDLYIGQKNNKYKLYTYKSGFDRRTLGRDGLFVDLNNDGLLDLLTFENSNLKIFKNVSDNTKNYIILDFENSIFSTGTKVSFFFENKEIIKELVTGTGYLRQKPNRIHIGLNNCKKVDSIIVNNNQLKEPFKFYNINSDSLYSINDLLKTEDNYLSDELKSWSYPVPFRDNVEIFIELLQNASISLKIYNVNGVLVKEFSNENAQKGRNSFKWDGITTEGNPSSSGVYLYILKVDGKEINGRIIKSN